MILIHDTNLSISGRIAELKKLTASIPLVVLAFFCFSEQISSAKTLEIGVEHSEMLSPVPASLQVGKTFRMRTGKSVESDRWAIIPNEAAGQWRLIRKFDVSTIDLKTGRRVMQPSDQNGNEITYGNSITYIGYQTNDENRIWTSADIESKLPHSNGTYLVPAEWDLRVLNDHSFSTMKRGVSLTVSSQDNKIIDAKQIETLATFEVVAPDRLVQQYSTKWFNASGEAIKLTEGQTEMQKIGDFKPINELNGIDIKSSFRRFLRARVE